MKRVWWQLRRESLNKIKGSQWFNVRVSLKDPRLRKAEIHRRLLAEPRLDYLSLRYVRYVGVVPKNWPSSKSATPYTHKIRHGTNARMDDDGWNSCTHRFVCIMRSQQHHVPTSISLHVCSITLFSFFAVFILSSVCYMSFLSLYHHQQFKSYCVHDNTVTIKTTN